MFFAILLPATHREIYYNKFYELFKREFADIDADYLLYDRCKDVSALLDGKQKKYDAIIFACAEVYHYLIRRLKAEIAWFFVPVTNAALYRGLFQAQRLGWELGRLSFDTYEESMLHEIYKELNYPPKKYRVKCYPVNPSHPDQCFHAFNFHGDNYMGPNGSSGCITALPECASLMEKAHIPHVLVHPSLDEIRACIQSAKNQLFAALDEGSKLSAISVNIGFPPDYIVIDHSDFSVSATRLKGLELTYQYARKISGAVFEMGANDFTIVTTSEILKRSTDNFMNCELLEWLHRECTNVVSIGIGSSMSASNAVKLSKQALRKSMELGRSSCVVMLDNKSLYTIEVRKTSDEDNRGLIGYCEEVAAKSHIGSETVARIISVMAREHASRFTANSLAEALSVSRRHADRLLDMLEIAGYAATVGKEIRGKKGRPSRIVEIFLSA